MIKKNEEYIVDIIDYGADGEGIAKIDNFIVFVNRALKGEKVKIVITKVVKSFAYGRILDILEASPNRQVPDCDIYVQCGGCNLRHIKYEETLKIKKHKVQNLMDKALKHKVQVEDTIGMENPMYYRNKTIYPVSKDKKIGFYKERTHDVVEANSCLVQSEIGFKIASKVAEMYDGDVYDEETKEGYLRNIMIRHCFATGEIMVVIVQTDDINRINVDELVNEFKEIKTILININNKVTNVVLSNENKVIYGDGFVTDEINGIKYKISANSFYQINLEQTKVIYDLAIKGAELNQEDILCDLYCGIGTIGMTASSFVNKVYGIEIVEDAIKDAKENAKLNGIDNIEFIAGDVEVAFDKLLKENVKPNAVIVDPPRRGLDNKTIENLNNLELEKLVYVSCNPATLARDLSLLEEKYKIVKITPVDNFPYTSHVESIAILRLK